MRVTPLVVGIAGGTGSGKSTVARKIGDGLRDLTVAYLDLDAYYRDHSHLTLEERRKVNWDHPDAFDFPLFLSHLAALKAGEGVDKPVYDFVTHTRSDQRVETQSARVIVVDGILLFVEETVRSALDLKVFVDADADVRLARRIARDTVERGRPVDEILEQFLTTVRPMHLQFVEPSKRYADLIVPLGGHNLIAIDMILASIRQLVSDRVS